MYSDSEYSQKEIDHVQAELKQVNFEVIDRPEYLRAHFNHSRGSTLLVINSMGTGGDSDGPKTRSAVIQALEDIKKLKDSPNQPKNLITVLGDVHQEATSHVRAYIDPWRLFIPAIALIKEGTYFHRYETVYYRGSIDIKKQSVDKIAQELVDALKELEKARYAWYTPY